MVVLVAVATLGVRLVATDGAAAADSESSGRSGAGERRSGEPPSMRELIRRANAQQFTMPDLLGNDQVDVEGAKVSHARIARAWETAKRVHLGDPQDPRKARELRAMYERYERQKLELSDKDEPDDAVIASARMRMFQPGVLWPGETDRDRRVRLTATLATDKATSGDFWSDVERANGDEPSGAVKAVCGAIALGPGVLGAVASALGAGESRAKLRKSCERVGKRTQDAVEDGAGAVGDFVKDPIGTLAKGVFGPIIGELHKATVYASKQVGVAIDKVATPDLGERWVRDMLQRAGAIAIMIALVAGILGVAHAAITANLGALGTVAARACLSGIVGSVVLTVITIAVAFVDELTTIATGSKPETASKPFATLAETASGAMAKAELPSFVTLILLLLLLLGLVVVWWEMWLRAPLLYAVAFFYGPAFSASLFPPARQLLSHLNSLLAALIVMPLVIIALLQMAAESLSGQDTIAAVLQSTGLILLAAASPGILIALFSPGVGLAAAAGVAGAFAGGRTVTGAGGKAASAGLGAASFARERLRATKNDNGDGDESGADSGPGGGGLGGGAGGAAGGGDRPPRPGDGGAGLGSTSTPTRGGPDGGGDSAAGSGSTGPSADPSPRQGGDGGAGLRGGGTPDGAGGDRPGGGGQAGNPSGGADQGPSRGGGSGGDTPVGPRAPAGGLDPGAAGPASGQRPAAPTSKAPRSGGTGGSGGSARPPRGSSDSNRSRPARPSTPSPRPSAGPGTAPRSRAPRRPPTGGGLGSPETT